MSTTSTTSTATTSLTTTDTPTTTDATTGDTMPVSPCNVPDGSVQSWIFATKDNLLGNLVPPDSWEANLTLPQWSIIGAGRGDAVCQCSAYREGLPGGFVAWLGTEPQPAADFLAPFTVTSRHFVRRDGVCVANDWSQLMSADHQAAIRIAQDGSTVSGEAWTGASDKGGPPDEWQRYCKDGNGFSWMSTAGKGDCGNVDHANAGWSDVSGNQECSTPRRLYCIQVADLPLPALLDLEMWCPKPHP